MGNLGRKENELDCLKTPLTFRSLLKLNRLQFVVLNRTGRYLPVVLTREIFHLSIKTLSSTHCAQIFCCKQLKMDRKVMFFAANQIK